MPLLCFAHYLKSKDVLLIFEQDLNALEVGVIKVQGQEGIVGKYRNYFFARYSGYYIYKNYIYFFLPKEQVPNALFKEGCRFFVVGTFNQWQKTSEWVLNWVESKQAWVLKCALSDCPKESFPFKFVSDKDYWIGPWSSYGYLQYDEHGNCNFLARLECSGAHWLSLKLKKELRLYEPCEILYKNSSIKVNLLPYLSSFYPKHALGSIVKKRTTYFGLFAPDLKEASVELFKDKHNKQTFPLALQSDGVWTSAIPGNYENYYYYFKIKDIRKRRIVDPYARQLVGPKGPGIITSLESIKNLFKTPKKRDLIILETHVRDLLENANVPKKYSLFKQLQFYFSKKNYVKDLGVNCIEFLPLTEYDTESSTDYHWGYMPAHFFALSSCYGTPEEFQLSVKTLHDANVAVILDVVYNHTGIKNALNKLNAAYYFRHEENGFLTNASGCGNDLRTESPFVRKLILDSLLYFIDTFHVDGFRFDLAELLGYDTLNYLSKELKKRKQDIILIAEPWSFRGHIAYALKGTDFSIWNDGFREFIFDYVNGRGNCEGVKYFIEGSTAYLCATAQQSINYTESHDDYTWIDRLELNSESKRKTHCMFALLFLSLGVPMLCEGQDFLRSKKKIRNTYNRGDLNFLNYKDLEQEKDTHELVKDLIAFRTSQWGNLLKVEKPSASYLQYFYSHRNSAICVLYNTDNSLGNKRILFAINPHPYEVKFEFEELNFSNFKLIADKNGFLKTSHRKSLLMTCQKLSAISYEILVCDDN